MYLGRMRRFGDATHNQRGSVYCTRVAMSEILAQTVAHGRTLRPSPSYTRTRSAGIIIYPGYQWPTWRARHGRLALGLQIRKLVARAHLGR